MSDVSLESLIKDLKSRDKAVRIQAIQAMGAFQPDRVLGHLAEALRDPDPQVRCQTATVLGFINDYRALAPLIKAMKDSELSVREAVARAFREMAEKAESEPSLDSQAILAELLANNGEQKQPAKSSRETIRSKAATFHGWAAWALSQMVDPFDQAEAARAGLLGWSEDAEGADAEVRALNTLNRLIADLASPEDWTRMAAAAVLETWKAPQVEEALKEAARSSDLEVQALARAILKRHRASPQFASPQVRLSIQEATDLRVGERGAITIAAHNKGDAPALEVELLLDNSAVAQGTRIGKLEPGQTQASQVQVVPLKHGAKVPFTVTASFTDEKGKRGQVMAYAFFPVLPGAAATPEAEPFTVCLYCGEGFNLPKTPSFCPYCGEALVS